MIDRDGLWSQLWFEEVALTEFRFLESQYAYTMLDSSASRVRFLGNNVVVSVEHNRASFEITVVVELPTTGERFTVWEIARLAGVPNVDEHASLQATTRETVEELLPTLAELLRRHGESALKGDPQAFARLRDQQWRESERFLRAERSSTIREAVKLAWQAGNFGEVVRRLEGVKDGLSKAELAMLAYARKRVKQ